MARSDPHVSRGGEQDRRSLEKIGTVSAKTFFSLIKIEHTLFARPLALTGAVLGARGMPDLWTLLVMAVAFTAARAAAMAFNRLVDSRLDARNPRTAEREIPTGAVGLGVVFWTAGFDILYACQDVEFDREKGLHSIPANLGTGTAMKLAA
ncbi:MAG TPA: UbiA family prenyltransferase, partial [Deltaproteobacteria bacterium]|nr:UbiA family prenyltransferase [Deltaproteobacteria bacterium]